MSRNQPYLDKCIESLIKSYGVELDIIVVSDSAEDFRMNHGPNVRYIHDHSLKGFSAKVDAAVKHAKHDLILLTQDDVIVSRDCIANLATIVSKNKCIINPMSNNDNNSLYATDIRVGNFSVPNSLNIEDFKDQADMFCNAIMKMHRPEKMLIAACDGWLPMYCTMFTKDIYNEVGPLDPKLDIRYNDVDWCLRARAKGIQCYIELGAFALHWGSKTIGKYDLTEQYKEADRYFAEKRKSGRL